MKKVIKPTMDLDRSFSWSAQSSFEYDKEQWYQKYVVHGKCTRNNGDLLGWCVVLGTHNPSCPQVETSYEMEFGKFVGERLASDPKYLPHIPRLSIFEYKLECKFGKIKLVGYVDSLEPITKLFEYKTGRKAWDQKRADEHGQILFYLFCLYLMHKTRPEQIENTIFWMPTQQNGDFSISFVNEKDMRSFNVKHTMRDVLEFGQRINRVYKEMQEYSLAHN